MGVGGSWSATPHSEYILNLSPISFSFTLIPFEDKVNLNGLYRLEID